MRLAKLLIPKKLWILFAILFIALCVLQYFDFQTIENSNIGFLIFLASLFVINAGGIVLGLLTALIRFGNNTFEERFKITFPLSNIFTAIVLIMVSGYFVYVQHVKMMVTEYDKVEIPADLDCSTVHEGKFEDESLVIERFGNTQIQREKNGYPAAVYKLEWLSDCEYRLIRSSDSSEQIIVKIVAVTDSGFDCFAGTEKYLFKYRYTRLNASKNGH